MGMLGMGQGSGQVPHPPGCASVRNKVKPLPGAKSPVLTIMFSLKARCWGGGWGWGLAGGEGGDYRVYMYFKQNDVRIFTNYIPSIGF